MSKTSGRLRAALTLMLLLASVDVWGQSADSLRNVMKWGFWRDKIIRLEELLDIRDGKVNYDTLYMRRSSKGLRLRLSVKSYGSGIDIRGVYQDNEFKTHVAAMNKYTVSVSANYRGLALSLALNPGKLSGRNKDFEVALNSYGNRLGAELVFQTANTFHGTVTTASSSSPLSTGVVGQDMFMLTGYYAFGGKRFSYPAAFGQSWRQLKSCGSWMIGLSLFGRHLDIGENEVMGTDGSRISNFCIGIGPGYAYNFVLHKGWLLHVSVQPELVVYNYNKMKVSGGESVMSSRFPDFASIGRLSVSRTFKRYFAGLYSVVDLYNLGDPDKLEIQNIKWQACVFVGVRL